MERQRKDFQENHERINKIVIIKGYELDNILYNLYDPTSLPNSLSSNHPHCVYILGYKFHHIHLIYIPTHSLSDPLIHLGM